MLQSIEMIATSDKIVRISERENLREGERLEAINLEKNNHCNWVYLKLLLKDTIYLKTMNAFESVHFKKIAYVHVAFEIIGKKWRLSYVLLAYNNRNKKKKKNNNDNE